MALQYGNNTQKNTQPMQRWADAAMMMKIFVSRTDDFREPYFRARAEATTHCRRRRALLRPRYARRQTRHAHQAAEGRAAGYSHVSFTFAPPSFRGIIYQYQISGRDAAASAR